MKIAMMKEICQILNRGLLRNKESLFMFQRVAIIGMGLIGGSIGLALRKKQMAGQVIGYDLGEGVCERACRIGAIDQYYNALTDTVRGVELVILATPVGAIYRLLQELAPILSPGTVVTDVASTKVQVIKWAEELLPKNISFVGGHPMAGREVSGIDMADATLFHGRIYCLTPAAHTSTAAVSKVCSLAEVLGARVHFLEPATHDELVAGVSHLPFLASVALMNTVAGDSTWNDAALLAASGFRDVSRLAAGSPEMYRDICLTNGGAIVNWLDKYIEYLQVLREQVADHDGYIDTVFAQAQQKRFNWQKMQNDEK
jgi:prephenate dehydrogenase